MKERLFRGDVFEHERSRRDVFDPIAEGKRYGLAPEVSAALWEHVRREATTSDGVCDESAARARFVQLAELIARRGGKLGLEPFHWTQVDVASGLLPAANSLAERVPGRTTLVLAEASARARASLSGVPGRTTLVASYATPEVSSTDESRGFFRRYLNGSLAARAKLECAIAARDHYAALVAVGTLKQEVRWARHHLANGLDYDEGLTAELAALEGPAEQLLAQLPNMSAGGWPRELWGPDSAEWRAATGTTDDPAPTMENVGPRAETQRSATWQSARPWEQRERASNRRFDDVDLDHDSARATGRKAFTLGREADAFAVGTVLRGDLITISQVLALDTGQFDIVVDALPGVRGMQLGATVYLDPDALAAGGETARYVLAHELVHLAQRALPARPELDYMAAEAEAASLGRAYARGHGLKRPSVGLGSTQVARDEGGQSDDAKLLASPPPLVRSVGLFAVTYKPATDTKWVGGIDKKRQALAATLQDLVGKSAYSVQLLDQVITACGGSDRFVASGNIEGKATQDDAVRQFTIQGSLMLDLVKIVTDKGLKVLAKENLEALQGGIDATDTWEDFKGYVPDWMTKNLYASLIALTAKTVLTRYAKGLRAATDKGGATAEKELVAARQAALDAIGMPIDVMETVRADKKLVKEPAYRVLWDLPAVAETKDEEVAVAASDRPPAQLPAFYFLTDQLVDKTLAKQALASHDARKKVLERFSTRLALRQLPTDGDTVLSDSVNKPARPPLGSTLTTYPQLEPPFFDTPKGGDREFVMSIAFSDVFEAFRGYVYKWELIRVPDDTVEKLNETADDMSQHGTSPGQLDVLGGRLSRDVEYGSADIRRAIGVLKSQLGEPGIGAVSLAAVGSALRMVGTVIKTSIETLLKPRYEKTMPFDSDGLYIVRCISWPQPNSSSVIDRAPSVAWLPVWVRPTRDMSKLRANFDDKIRLGGIDRLKEIEDELKDPELMQQRRDELNNEKKQIETSLHGTGDDVLVMEKQQLETAAKTAEGFQLEQIKKRIAEIEEIQKMRTSRIAGATTDGSLEALTRIPAAFVGDNAQTIRPLFEVYQKVNSGTQLVYHAIDSTTEKSGHRDGEGAKREDAIANAIQNILESNQGYGRGYATITIPATPDTPDAPAAQRTIRIEKSLGGIMEEALDNLATIAAIAAVAAAPFTGGASLALLVPIGIVGAIPSAYRLIDRGQQGMLRFDMATAMDVVNILGAAVGAGQASAAGKAALRGVQLGRGWMILGLGTDGLGMLVAGAGVIDQINELSKDPNMPPGLRNAMIAQIVGNQLIQISMAVGAQLAIHGKAQAEHFGGKATAEPVGPRVPPELTTKFHEAVGPSATEIPVFRDQSGTQVKGDGVEVRSTPDGYGLPSDVHVIMGPTATETGLMQHVKAARASIEFQGFFGYLRNLLDRITILFKSGKLPPKPGSRAWTAKVEIEKLTGIVATLTDDLGKGAVTPEAYASKLKDYQQQMARHEQALNDYGAGPGVIAVHDTATTAAQSKGYPAPPKDHYYYETGDGKYQLQRAADSAEPPRHIEFKDGAPILVAGEPAGTGAVLDLTRIKDVAGQNLGKPVVVHGDATVDQVIVRPMPNGTYELHFKSGTPEYKIQAAIERHLELRAARPDDLTEPVNKTDGTPWTGADEAAYQGRLTEDDQHWALSDGKLITGHGKQPWTPPKGWNGPDNHGEWIGERGNSGWIDDRPEVIRIVGRGTDGRANPIEFRSGVIDFKPWSRGELIVEGLTGKHEIDMKKIRLAIADREGLAIGESHTARTKAARAWLNNADDGHGGKGLRPHHAGGNKVELIPTDVHKVQHTDLFVYPED